VPIVHKVLILGDSHARGCASEVKLQLNNEYNVYGFINPGSRMKDIKESAKMKMAQLRREDIVVLWGKFKLCCKKQFHSGHKTYIRSIDTLISYQCDTFQVFLIGMT